MIYERLFSLVLGRLDPELAHRLAFAALRRAMAPPGVRRLLRALLASDTAALQVRAFGRDLRSPLGVAAGVDKDACCVEELAALGFAFVEVGTVTARPQTGAERPRVLRLAASGALVNRMGFPNVGAARLARRLARTAPPARAGARMVGVNVGKSKVVPLAHATEDYCASVRVLAPHADYLVLNVSSPNTPELRDMQSVERLSALIASVRAELSRQPRRVPLLVKIAPDLSDAQLDAIVDVALAMRLDGIVATNTTTAPDAATAAMLARAGASDFGGLSGVPLKARSLEVLRRVRSRCGSALTLVSVGGIETPEDAWERILAGATLVQAYTAFVYGGPLWPARMNRGLARLVRRAGFDSIEQAIGAGAPAHPSAPGAAARIGACTLLASLGGSA